MPRKINVSGTQTAITLATQLITYVMENGPILPPSTGGMGGGMQQGGWNGGVSAPVQSYGGMQHQVMDCAKAFVGKYTPFVIYCFHVFHSLNGACK